MSHTPSPSSSTQLWHLTLSRSTQAAGPQPILNPPQTVSMARQPCLAEALTVMQLSMSAAVTSPVNNFLM